MSQQVKNEIKILLASLLGKNFEMDETEDLASLSGVDSLIILQFMVALEKKFEVDFSQGDIEEIFRNINSLANYLENNKK